jgi:hypothetical protein
VASSPDARRRRPRPLARLAVRDAVRHPEAGARAAAAPGHLFAPFDAIFDLLEQSGATFRQQAEALEQAARALEDTAVLMKAQAEIFERGVRAIREPADLARSVAGLEKREKKKSGSKSKRS